jgi:FkbM family methyltransferase
VGSWKRQVVKTVSRVLNVQISRRGQAALLCATEELSRFFKVFEIDCVFDIGANTGGYARRLREDGYRGTIVSFEPIPALAAKLRVAAARDQRWFIEQVAMHERVQDVTFNIMSNHEFSSLNAPKHSETQLLARMNTVVETLTLRTATLDALYDTYKAKLHFQRPFLKMDTQGNDVAVARGAGDRLGQFVGLQSELAVKRLYEGQYDYRAAIDFYEQAGFVLTSLVPNNAGHFPDLIEIDCIMYNSARAGNHSIRETQALNGQTH